MFRKILIAVVASLSLLSPLALPASTEASPVAVHPHRHGYRVLYRSCNAEPWRVAGSFRSRQQALREVHILRARGLEAVIRGV